MQDKITNVFIGDGTFAGTSVSAETITSLGIVNQTMSTPASATPTVALSPILYVANKLADGSLKRSVPINGTSVFSYKLDNYAPAQRCVWAIGYDRKLKTGSIEVNNATAYSFDLHFVNDKTFYSERPEYLRVDFTSSATATQLSLATQIAGKINSSAFGASPAGMKVVNAIIVSDGPFVAAVPGVSPAIYGDGTSGSASVYGVEIMGLDINQFRTTTYTIEKVNFSVQCDSSTGFGLTTVNNINLASLGIGTYEEIYVAEKVGKRNEGVLNWTLFPIPEQDYLTSKAGFTSGTLADTGYVNGTSAKDILTFQYASNSLLPAGSIIKTVSTGAVYEIKYWIDTTHAVVTSPLVSTLSNAAISFTAWYNMVTIGVQDVTSQDGSGVMQLSKKIITIATPATSSGAVGTTSNGNSPAGTAALYNFLQSWVASTAYASIPSGPNDPVWA